MSATHDEQALAAPYVLGALEASERRAFEAHLATCPICLAEVRSLQPVADALAHAVPQQTPRPELRRRVLGGIPGTAPGVTHDRPARSTTAGWLPLAAAVIVSAGLGVYAWTLQGRVASLETRLDSAERRAAAAERDTLEARRAAGDAKVMVAVLEASDLVRIELAGQKPAPSATARALWSRNRGMVFSTSNLPPPPPGSVYQVWVLAKGAPISAGLLSIDQAGRGLAFFQTPSDIPPPTGVAVSLEPSGGRPQPTGDIYLHGAPGP